MHDIERPESIRDARVATPGERLCKRFGFTKTEAKVISGLLEGLSYNEIAETLGVSYHTVHTHIKAIHQKARVSTNGRLTALVRSVLEKTE